MTAMVVAQDGGLVKAPGDHGDEDAFLSSAVWPAAYAITDADFRIIKVSPSLRTVLGLPADDKETARVTLSELLTAPSRVLLRTALEIALWNDRGLTDVLLEFRGADGGTVPMIAAAAVTDERRSALIRWVFIAAPRRAEFERRLMESRRELRRLTEELQRANFELSVSKAEVERQARELAERAGQLERAASSDPLTGALNRRGLEDVAKLRGGLRGTLLVLDIDHFKHINDTRGHAVGDRVLIGVAEALRKHLRPNDVIARIGGEEFVVWASMVGADTALRVADRLREGIAEDVSAEVGFSVTVSVGVGALHDEASDLLWQEVARVDQALYAAKAAGRNRVAEAPSRAPGRADKSDEQNLISD